MSDFTRKRRRMSYAASFKLKAVEAAEKTSNVEAAKKFEGLARSLWGVRQ